MSILRKDIKRYTFFDSGFVIKLSDKQRAEVDKVYDEIKRKREEVQANGSPEPAPELHI